MAEKDIKQPLKDVKEPSKVSEKIPEPTNPYEEGRQFPLTKSLLGGEVNRGKVARELVGELVGELVSESGS
jgi:hypothetical protein